MGKNINVISVVGVISAGTINARVGVAFLRHGAMVLVVAESLTLPATVATAADFITVDELLLREGEEITGRNLHGTFEGTSGGESPAGTTLTLILDGVDGTLGDPVDAIGEVGTFVV
jgi:hypothetical protein